MNIKRKLDTTKAEYDITGLTTEQFVKLLNAYTRYLFYTHHTLPADDELLTKLEKMRDSNIYVI